MKVSGENYLSSEFLNRQFAYLHRQRDKFTSLGNPIISVEPRRRSYRKVQEPWGQLETASAAGQRL
jgi:hypothetical protein